MRKYSISGGPLKQIIFALFSILALASCSNGGGGGGNNTAASTTDSNAGSFFVLDNVQGGSYVHLFKIEGTNKFTGLTVFIPTSQQNLIYRKSVGTFAKSGSVYTISYSYSTCGGTNSESLEIKGDPKDILSVKEVGSPTSIAFRSTAKYYITGYNENNMTSATEDTSCNLLSKLIGKTRNVASDKKKSFFAEIQK